MKIRPIQALVVKKIVLTIEGETIFPGETILVDVTQNVGCWKDRHFDIFPDEYLLLN